eukprot:CAMPEP_0196802434 /NCGR_PEP_ID=MMETSP1362-20130617/2044_1 /TAXON_ID=163516 /ORGANISM="Leptocylindrus danicus, Strain CCMP1856" /LENGTH=672 /DNA_ID=CAMNT_0042173733 /DNA_START=281 /DNA_END=2299 /DNA_ORIENTATION=+
MTAPATTSTLTSASTLQHPKEQKRQNVEMSNLPFPILKSGKEKPMTSFISKNFAIEGVVSHTTMHAQQARDDYTPIKNENKGGVNDDDKEEEHVPAGQHLLVDIKNVDAEFLDCENCLAQAMVDVAYDSDLTLLSYHCHSLQPMGVSCVGVLLESHISLHTWPSEGVITLDLFTCGEKPLLPSRYTIEKLFGIPQQTTGMSEEDAKYIEEPVSLWMYKSRGFPSDEVEEENPLNKDIGEYLMNKFIEYKEEVASVETDFQRIDVYDLIDVRFNNLKSFRTSLSQADSYEAANPQSYLPDRVLFLDGIMQSTRIADEAYHETLVHPGMFAHKDPKRVAIIGGGECATLREVLKHRTVEHVKMIEIDGGVVEVSKEFLPSWSDCSDLRGSTPSCTDDPRADIRYEDAIAWFEANSSKGEKSDLFDVIISDALDPQEDVPFANGLYNDSTYSKSLFDSLADDGVLIFQLGRSPVFVDPADEMSKSRTRALLLNSMIELGYQAMHIYVEGHAGFGSPWAFLIACKKSDCSHQWNANQAQIEKEIHRRMLRTYSGTKPLKYFDGAIMMGYQKPTRAWEQTICRRSPAPDDCILATKKIRIPELANAQLPPSSLNIAESLVTNVEFVSSVAALVNYTVEMGSQVENPPKLNFSSALKPVAHRNIPYGVHTSNLKFLKK